MFASKGRARATKTKVWPAPVKGWLASGNLGVGQIDAAEVLDNFFPTAQGARLRYGSILHATVDDTVVRFMPYIVSINSRLFASTATDIFEVSTPADAAVTPTASLTGLRSGDWVSVQFTTSGGAFMVAVNGTDAAIYYDGTELQPLVGQAINDLPYDARTGAFTVGQTVTGGTSGATAEIIAIAPTSATEGKLKVGAITGTFQDNEAITDSVTGAAVANGTASSASAITITGIDTSAISHVWMFKERLFFIEKGTLSAWYLPVDSIGGAAVEFSMGSVFKRGGSLLFGATWSLDSGSGLDDKCVFVTDQGEIAVYDGTDPSSASTWSLSGVYQVGFPVDKHAALQVGGDVVLVTGDGMVPLSQAVVRERTALMGNALTYPIEDAWRGAVAGRTSAKPITATLWQSKSMLLVGTGTLSQGVEVSFVANAQTGAWCRYLGWDVQSSVIFEDRLFFGTPDGLILRGEVGGEDNGNAYTGFYVPKFSDFGEVGLKFANHVGLVSRAPAQFNFNAQIFSNNAVSTITPAQPIADSAINSTWGSGVWGTSIWGGGSSLVGQDVWKTAGASGFTLAPVINITSFQTAAPQIEVIQTKVRYEVGNPL